MTKGIIERIQSAETSEEIDHLLRELDGYKKASPRTLSRAKRVAEKRKKEVR